MTKYLYGKRAYLDRLLLPEGSLRFYDINYFKQLENDKIKDDESKKEFQLKKEDFSVMKIGEHPIPSSNFVGPVKISIPTKRCHVLCLSDEGYSPILFEHFNADMCFEINVDMLVQILEDVFEHKKGPIVRHQAVKYMEDLVEVESIKCDDIVFIKKLRFAIEKEYRIAIFYPYNEKTSVTLGDKLTPLFDGGYHYFELGYSAGGINIIINEARSRDGSILYKKQR